MHENISKILDIEKYMTVMSAEELRETEKHRSAKGNDDYDCCFVHVIAVCGEAIQKILSVCV